MIIYFHIANYIVKVGTVINSQPTGYLYACRIHDIFFPDSSDGYKEDFFLVGALMHASFCCFQIVPILGMFDIRHVTVRSKFILLKSHTQHTQNEYSSRFENEDTVHFCLRVMVGVIILYDYIHPVGAFAKKAAIDVRV